MGVQAILHPTDFSARSQRALEEAATLAPKLAASLVLLHVVDTLGPEKLSYGEAASSAQPEHYRSRLWESFHRCVRVPDSLGPVEWVLGEGDTAAIILRVAYQRRCGLIVMAGHGQGGWGRRLFRSTAERVARRAPCPVLIVPPAPPAPHPVLVEGTWLHPVALWEAPRPPKSRPG